MTKKQEDKPKKAEMPSGTFAELKLMVTDYAKQETVEPLKNLGKWAGLGVGGAVVMGIGAFLTGLGMLRLFQKMDWATGKNDGDYAFWSFMPYIFVFLILVVCAAVCLLAMKKTPEWMDDDA